MREMSIRESIELLCEPGSVYELRAFNIPMGSYTSRVESGYFNDLGEMAENAEELSRLGAAAVYFTPNPTNPDLLARRANRMGGAKRGQQTSDRDIDRRRWFLVDVDPKRPAGISSTEEEHKAAVMLAALIAETLRQEGWPAPIVGDSGNGAHLMWRVEAENTPENTTLFSDALKALHERFSTELAEVDTTVFNAARIWKVPGTMARKGDHLPERPHRRSGVVHVPEELKVLSLERLRRLRPEETQPEEAGAPKEHTSRPMEADSEERFEISDFVQRHFPEAEGVPYNGGTKWVLDVCPFNEAHDDRSAVIIELASGALSFRCHHNGCRDRDWSELRALFDEEYRAQRELNITGDHINRMIASTKKSRIQGREMKDAVTESGIPTRAVEAKVEGGGRDHWRQALICNKKGELLSLSLNAKLILQNDELWEGVLGYDCFNLKTVTRREPPWSVFDAYHEIAPWYPGRPWEDTDDLRAADWLFQTYEIRISAKQIHDRVQQVAESKSFHPVRDYLKTLKWDGEERLSTWLQRYLGVPDSDYASLVGRWWLISAVARVMDPGCKVDTVLILEGDQGLKKSTALSILGGDWFSDTPMDLGSKDSYLALRGRWIVELAELDSLSRSASTRAKAFFSSPVDSFRPPYGRSTIDQPRQCVFVGSTNEQGYLRDFTGARRFWPVKCTSVEVEDLLRDRDQLWVEALRAFEAGEVWFPRTEEENKVCRVEQEKRFEEDAWENSLAEWVHKRTDSYFTTWGIMEDLLEVEKGMMDIKKQRRIGQILSRLGFERKRKRVDGVPKWVYVRGPETARLLQEELELQGSSPR